ncbi:rhodanese [Virgibacillus dokdonensis]|uniref:Rhodanese-related sulfurtransferase n=2 Tax=Virgibacillus TaxID=84406 RepID=A0A1M5VX94_9BACI|nr:MULTISPECIES: rhodanese-like domain-containing protein [Virgibacillus]RFA35968.1 rhodanese [Virgibacillus dokdonensis]SHH79800.1 Rhodanese-related sulfurtransferase [Virgibacillus chiguensis]
MKEITTQDLIKRYQQDQQIKIIDVREDDEVALGKVPGARHIPLGDVANRVQELNKDEHYYVICRSGGRSATACQILEENNIDCTNIAGGMLAWDEEVEI